MSNPWIAAPNNPNYQNNLNTQNQYNRNQPSQQLPAGQTNYQNPINYPNQAPQNNNNHYAQYPANKNYQAQPVRRYQPGQPYQGSQQPMNNGQPVLQNLFGQLAANQNMQSAGPAALTQFPPEPEEQDPYKDKNSMVDILFQKQHRIISTPNQLVCCFLVFGLIFSLLAAITLFLNLSVKSMEVDYSYSHICKGTDKQSNRCSTKFQVSQDMPAPVYIVYYVKNIYINHRTFLTSYSVDQLKGKTISVETAQKVCHKYVFNKQLQAKNSWGGTPLQGQEIASPCGLKSQGYFNDSFLLYKDGNKVNIDSSNIYKGQAVTAHRAPNSQSTQWIDPEDQHYKLYLLDGSLLTKKRLWGVINQDLKAGQYQLITNNNYRIIDMKITKGLLITTASIMGGKQFFYSIAFAICALFCFAYAIFIRIQFREFGKFQSYNKNK